MGLYHKWTHGGGEFGAVYDLGGPMFEGVAPHWLVYVLVDEVDTSVARAKELGGTAVLEPTDVMDHGRMAILADPTGAVFALWQAEDHLGGTTDPGVAGAPIWCEPATRDRDASTAFYTGLFGWRADHKSDGPMPYTEWWDGEACRGGMLVMGEEMGETPPHWLTYFSVDDCDACVSKAAALGGRGGSACVWDGVDRVVSEAPDRRRIGGFVEIRERSARRERRRPARNDFRHGLLRGRICAPALDIPGVGRVAVVTDPQGATFAVIRMSHDAK